MAVSQRLDLRQTQSLVMTPQLQQAIKLLQLTNLELATYLEGELERNPLLEPDETPSGSGEAPPGEARSGEAPAREDTAPAAEDSEAPTPDSADMARAETLPSEAEAPLDADYGPLYDNSPADEWTAGPAGAPAGGGGDAGFENRGLDLEQRAAEPVTLRRHLLDQLNVDAHDPADRMIGLHLIDALDDAGYLRVDVDTLARDLAGDLGCAPERVLKTLRLVQGFEPAGLFARDLRECLALQLADRNRLDPAMEALLDNLNLIAKRDYAALRQICGVDQEDFADMLAELKALDPKPAQSFDAPAAQPVVPDILMRAAPDGSWIIELNAETLPRVLVNTRYYARVSAHMRTQEEREYISAQLQSANWLVRALHQRANTIIRVAGQIVRQQDAFFRRGVEHLRPLTLRDIAEAIEMHESTVSRVTANKYIATPRGIHELKYFFTAAIAGADGGTHSAEAVRHRIRALIDGETSKNVLSDDAVVAHLRAAGVDIARRTVAKYRVAMRIPSSVQRRRDKAPRP
ncbi:MAG: RNA polymerase factor sigma-54 [Kiloniellaceae bacterium]